MSILNESLADRVALFGGPSADDAETLLPQNGMSYLQGPKTPPLSYSTIPQLLRDAVSRFGPREALVFAQQERRLSYYDLDRAVDQLAAGFLALGLTKGDRLGIWSPNRLEWVLTQFATARIGIILVNINPAYRLAELDYALNKSGCVALILAPSFKSSNYLQMIQELAPELASCKPGALHSARLPALRHVVVMQGEDSDTPGGVWPGGVWSFDQLSALGGPAQQLRLPEIDQKLSPDDAINIQFTSGTTGSPKGATLSHYNIVNNARFVTGRIRLSEEDRLALPVPLYHCFGMVMGVLGAVSKGATMVFPGEGFDAAQVLDCLENEKCSALYGVPTMFVAMLQELDRSPRDLTSLRTGIMAGAPCPIDVMRRVSRDMNMKEVTICYGMTETAPVSFQSFTEDPLDRRCETVGRIHPHLEVKLVDAKGQIVSVGQPGELCTRGYSVMKSYWQDPDTTSASIRDGWMHTGDLAVLDADGYCTITGRIKDMIIRGGENIAPREVEDFLSSHPKVSAVQVFGISDATYGEEVCAWVVGHTGETLTTEELSRFCQGQITHFKIPRKIRIVLELPMTITGKPQKFLMRQQEEKLQKEARQTPENRE
ncbi:Long-chain-fatty-acid--CoA ligase [Phaeobacter sp. CECT 5382]|uniref:AMP-binding protein n=1 Tax=Phaeobacter sp. CECT 5382 TaxID=1712645 RepID=UPI0006DAEA2C|nr:AMP-binding protein [Phaeobacter sp. CECT 5382]CUH88763.1 Long-chain-fatty-acid--CoA ligase [Phaeobacter sp. CECT 5382]